MFVYFYYFTLLICGSSSTGTFPVTWMALAIGEAPDNGTLADDTLWITEETPGETFYGDATAVLQEQMYWASYLTRN
jgi:hypothetical protein